MTDRGVLTKSGCIASVLFAGLMLVATQAFADIGVMVLEPVGPIGFLTHAGHSAIYLSNICPDGSPIRLRLCHAGERGGVISKYTPISENEDYDWAIVPFDRFLSGFDSPALSPLIGTSGLQRAIQDDNFDPFFSGVLTVGSDGLPPTGEWRTTLATRFDRTIYVFSIATTLDEDRAIVDAFNAAPNRSRFNFFYDNCSNQTKEILNLILPKPDAIGDRVGGLTMEVPKGIAKSLVHRSLKHPELQLHVDRYTQVPGTFPRSHNALFPLENTYKNISFLPYWYFVGYSEVALGAMVYHQLLSPFSLIGSMKDFLSPRAAQLTFEQRQRRDGRLRPKADVKNDKSAEIRRVLGSREQWRALEEEFRSTAHDVALQATFPDAVTQSLLTWSANGKLSRQLLEYFEKDGQFYVNPSAGGPWMRLQLSGPEWQATGLSEAHVLAGSPRLAFLVLATVIDYNLSQPDDRREPFAFMERVSGLLKQTRTSLVAGSPDSNRELTPIGRESN